MECCCIPEKRLNIATSTPVSAQMFKCNCNALLAQHSSNPDLQNAVYYTFRAAVIEWSRLLLIPKKLNSSWNSLLTDCPSVSVAIRISGQRANNGVEAHLMTLLQASRRKDVNKSPSNIWLPYSAMIW